MRTDLSSSDSMDGVPDVHHFYNTHHIIVHTNKKEKRTGDEESVKISKIVINFRKLYSNLLTLLLKNEILYIYDIK